ncbi:MAG: hypothetical protein U5N58_10640 [Actinomycetota bacterium]|nr:hypothetical protein [Actinomycetota bacterium]
MVKQNARDIAYKILDQYFNKQEPLNSALDNILTGKSPGWIKILPIMW